uniref:Peroxin 20 n=1 Tax=Talaromyces marneffei PM1 TaxID=1077442 RepID=A0A093Y7W7_TALMA
MIYNNCDSRIQRRCQTLTLFLLQSARYLLFSASSSASSSLRPLSFSTLYSRLSGRSHATILLCDYQLLKVAIMADALCGPSNALQNFQKHTAVDRTLQQDRIVNRHPSTQNFRSQHHNAAVLDPEFEAFENNFVGNAPPQLMPGGPAFAAPVHSQPPPGFAAADGDWASDFQKLQVSGPSLNINQSHGSDLIGATEESNAQGQKEDPDELARTAGHLLDSLSHDTSQKFKESSFLALMRRIRDREVHIEGDEFRESQQPLHPGGKDYPGKRRAGGTEGPIARPASNQLRPE